MNNAPEKDILVRYVEQFLREVQSSITNKNKNGQKTYQTNYLAVTSEKL